ncbi:unnamed protein product [Protopolystoma xenopodis]|uniref:Protein kinase domain-containing protein n=1 Tax=Protopolystoma xenopodis TaxID=117903 RepID=A0A448WG82_9PLAT|nr:unnamed protein product [Protopolystoma xenopodis]
MPWENQPGQHLSESWKLELPSEVRGQVTSACHDFMHRMLLRHPKDRLSLSAAMRHSIFACIPWTTLIRHRGPDLNRFAARDENTQSSSPHLISNDGSSAGSAAGNRALESSVPLRSVKQLGYPTAWTEKMVMRASGLAGKAIACNLTSGGCRPINTNSQPGDPGFLREFYAERLTNWPSLPEQAINLHPATSELRRSGLVSLLQTRFRSSPTSASSYSAISTNSKNRLSGQNGPVGSNSVLIPTAEKPAPAILEDRQTGINRNQHHLFISLASGKQAESGKKKPIIISRATGVPGSSGRATHYLMPKHLVIKNSRDGHKFSKAKVQLKDLQFGTSR